MDKGEHQRETEPVDEEKPLKKARYLWQVKGKSHLKTAKSYDQDQPCCSSAPGPPVQSGGSPQENCCIQAFLAKTEDIMDKDSSDEDDSDKLPLENCIENEIPVTLVSAQPRSQDYYLKKWQARQIARGFVDNTINSMLENWGAGDQPFDAANLIEDCANDGQVEDDAILMAIQSHGLQSGWRGPNNPAVASSSHSSETYTEPLFLQESSSDNLENLRKEQENDSSSSSLSVDTTSSISNLYEGELGDPIEFLNAAVSVAIHKKGLTY